MAVTVTSNLTLVDTADTTTGWVGNSGGTDTEVYVQGGTTPASWTWQSNKNTVKNSNFTPATNIDVSGYTYPHLYFWFRDDVIPFAEDKTTGTVNRSGLTVKVESDATNYKEWHMTGANTWRGEWNNFILDLNNTSDIYDSSGTLNLASIDKITWTVDLSNSGIIRIIDNTWNDVVRIGEGLTVYGTSFDISDIATVDVALANMYGIIQTRNGVYFAQGKLQIGDGTNTTTFNSNGESLIFIDPTTSGLNEGAVGSVHSSLYGIVANSTSSDTISFTGDVLSGSGTVDFLLDLDDTDISSLTVTGNTIKQASNAYFLASSTNATVTNNTFDTCGAIYPQGSKFENNTVTNTTETTTGAIYISSAGTLTNMKNITVTNYTGKYGIYIPASVTGTVNFDNIQLDNTGTDVYWAGTGGTLTISLSNSSNATSTATGGGTIVFTTAAVTTSVNVKNSGGTDIQTARVYMEAKDGTGVLPYQETVTITQTTGTATVSHTAHGLVTGDWVTIKGSTISAYNGVKSITKIDADSYTYTIDAGTASPATGTIVATGVIFNDLTDLSGNVSDTRSLSTDQPVRGWVRKSTTSPFYKTSYFTGLIDNENGLSLNILMISDE